ncbi:MAG TPA: hypothetical protein VM140_14255 [Burkholderiales bacterium]|nr:hypothetical protein [Burkholderiales bacterium]
MTQLLRLLLVAFLLACAQAHAQGAASSEEISFWETVRDSKNAAELQAYLDQYPNGRFAALAKVRLAALQRPAPAAPATARPAPAAKPAPGAVASFAPSAVTNETRMPQAGDTWTYQLSYPRTRGQWGQATKPSSTHVVKVGQVGDGQIIDQLSVDGGAVTDTTHSSNAYLGPQGASVFSPYLVAFRDLSRPASLGRVTSLDRECAARYICEASARVVGNEPVKVPAGTFNAVKVQVSHSWRSSGAVSANASGVAGMSGGRNLTVWYVPELKRAVKLESRATVGDTPPVEPTFDLELVSYQVK